MKAFNKAVRWIFRKKKSAFIADDLKDSHVQPLIQQTRDIFNEAVKSGIKHEIPELMQQHFDENVYLFSGAKTYRQLKEVTDMLRDQNRNIKPFHQFFSDVRQVHNTYNQNYLQAEYIFATQSAQMAEKWNEFQEDGDRYNLQYRTANDDRVRDEHQALHDTTLPPSDPFWSKYLPPNGWRCRCTTVQVRKSKYPESNSKNAIEAGERATEGRNDIFRFNPGKEQIIFPKHHPYFTEMPKTEKTET